MFTGSSDLSEREVDTFLRPAGASHRADERASRLITAVIGPATARLRVAGGLGPGVTVDDITMFIRMTVAADNQHSRAKAIDVLLDGLIRARDHQTFHSNRP